MLVIKFTSLCGVFVVCVFFSSSSFSLAFMRIYFAHNYDTDSGKASPATVNAVGTESANSSSSPLPSSTRQSDMNEYERLMSKADATLPFAIDATDSSSCVVC
jgi:hypothetical protein